MVSHIRGKTNIADIFMKEMCNSTNFRHLCDSLMCQASTFHMSSPHVSHSKSSVTPSQPGLLEVLASHASFCLPEVVLGLCITGQYLLCCLTSSFPMQALTSDPMGGVLMYLLIPVIVYFLTSAL